MKTPLPRYRRTFQKVSNFVFIKALKNKIDMTKKKPTVKIISQATF